MAVTITSRKWRGPRAYEITYESDLTSTDAPVFYIYVDGAFVARTRATTHILHIPRGEAPTIEIADSPVTTPASVPGKAELAWYAVTGAVAYRVEEYVDSAWVARATIRDTNAVRGHYQWRSRFLEDATEHQFRIIPIDAGGNEGTARTHTILMVRRPDPPVVTVAYNGSATPTVTITAVSGV